MKYKSFIFVCLLICFISMASVVATDLNETVVINEDQNDGIISVENDELISEDNNFDEVDASEDDELSTSTGTFTDLANEIANAGDELNLIRNYSYFNDQKFEIGIKIDKKICINGNGFTIDGKDQSGGLYVYYNNVTLKNIVFMNCGVHWYRFTGVLSNCSFLNCSNGAVILIDSDVVLDNCSFVNCNNTAFYSSGSDVVLGNFSFVNCFNTNSESGIVHWEGDNGILSNCSFVNCSGDGSGRYTVYWHGSNGTVSECSFVNCSLDDYNSQVIYWKGFNGTVSECSFVNYSAGELGCVVYWMENNGNLVNCSFVNCSSSGNGGAVYWSGVKGTLSGCSFVNCSVKDNNYDDSEEGGAVCWYGNNGNLVNCSFVNCSSSGYGGAIYWSGVRGTISGCSFVNSSSNYGGAINLLGDYCIVSRCNFLNCSAKGDNDDFSKDGGAVYWQGVKGTLSGCSFVNCYSSGYGGAVYWSGVKGTVSGCSFVNCSADACGGAIIWDGNNGVLSNCNFSNNFASSGGGAVHWSGVDGRVVDSIFNEYKDSIYWNGDNGQVIGCNYKKLISNGKCKVILKSFINIICSNNINFNEMLIINTTGVIGGGVVKLYVDNVFKKNLNIGETFNLSDLNAGKHIVKVSYNGDNYYTGCECSVNIIVSKINTEIQVLPINLVFDNTLINITLNNKTTGTVTININNKNYSSTVNNGKSSIYINNLDVKEYDYTLWYNGDQNFNKNHINGKLKTERKETSINISANDIFIGETLFIYYNITEGTTGLLKIYINDNYNQSVSVGQKIKFDNLMSGNYTVKVVYVGDNYHVSCEDCLNVIVKKHSSNFNFDVEDVHVGDYVFIKYNIVKNATGNLSVYIDEVPIKKVSVGKDIELSSLNVGKYALKVVYSGDDYYEFCEQITTFNVEKYNSYFHFSNDVPGKNVAIDLVFEDDATGHVNITFGGYTFYNQKLVNGKTTVLIPDLIGGFWHEYEVNYTGDERYKPLTEHNWDYVYLNDSPITLNIPELNWGDIFVINPSLPQDATGDIEILLDNVSLCNTTISKNYSYNLLNGGIHYLTIKYGGDYYFSENKTTFELNIKRFDSALDINSTIYANPSSLIVVKLNEEINGEITVIINDKKYSGYVVNGIFSFYMDNFKIGSNNAIINFTGDAKYNSIYTVKEINVLLKDAKLDIDICNIVSGENLVIKPTIVSEATGTFKIFVDNVLNTTINVGTTYYLYQQSLGKHEIKIVYSGDDYFESDTFTSVFRVFAKYPIESNDMQIIYGSNKYFQAKFYDEYGDLLADKYIIFNVNGEDISARTDSKGIAILKETLNIGEYDITIINPTANENTTNKLLIFTSVESEDVYTVNNTDFEFNVTFLDGSADLLQNIPVIFRINNEDKVVTTNTDGVATLKLSLDVGIYDIVSINTVTDESKINKLYVKSSSTGKYTRDIDDKDMVIPALPSSSTESVSVKLPSDAKGTITLTINGKDYEFNVTDGIAIVKVPELVNGNYPYVIKYSGDNKYSSFNRTGSLIVNKPSQDTTPIKPVIPTKPVTKTTLTIKKVKIKRSAKKLVIQATLKINGKAVKGKIIKFKFNKKSYKAKTNAKGVAKVTIKKNVLKKLKKGKKVTYTATYGKVTKKVSVKVKK